MTGDSRNPAGEACRGAVFIGFGVVPTFGQQRLVSRGKKLSSFICNLSSAFHTLGRSSLAVLLNSVWKMVSAFCIISAWRCMTIRSSDP